MTTAGMPRSTAYRPSQRAHHSPFPRRAVRAAGIGLSESHPSTTTSRERGASSVAEQSPSSDPLTSFGPNEWLVDELYEQYQKDRNSVDRAWWDFFKDYTPGEGALGRDAATAAHRRPPTATAAPDQRRRHPRRRPGSRRPRPAADTAHRPPRRPARHGTRPGRAARRRSPGRRAAAPGGPGPRGEGGAGHPPRARRPPSRPSRARPRRPRRPARSATPARPPSAVPAPASSPTWSPRSRCPPPPRVRAVPAKLLIDNRIVINNHLARSRGGKV